jgi:hypothetical protein
MKLHFEPSAPANRATLEAARSWFHSSPPHVFLSSRDDQQQSTTPLEDLYDIKPLKEALTEEMKYEDDMYEQPEEVSSGPPSPWQLTEMQGETLLKLTKNSECADKKETVTVTIDCSNQPYLEVPFDCDDDDLDDEEEDDEISDIDAEEDAAEEGSEEEEEEDEQEESMDYQVLLFRVEVSKQSKKNTSNGDLIFDCSWDRLNCDLEIRRVLFQSPSDGSVDDEGNTFYRGPTFDALDPDLQDSFYGYLEERGINEEFLDYVQSLSEDKEIREYRAWLDKVAKFV